MDQRGLGKRIMLLHMLRRRMLHNMKIETEIIPGLYPLLKYLSRNPDASQQDLASMLFVSPASVAQSTKRLQSAGMLEKTSDPDNLRKNRLRITPAGQAIVDSFQPLVDVVDQKTFRGFSNEEILQLQEYHNRMIRNLATTEDLDTLREMELADSAYADKQMYHNGNGGK